MQKRNLPSLLALRAFEAAARHLSFSQAATELHVSQSAISHHIRQLELELGTPLFVRLTRALSLTPAGAAMLPLASQGLDLLAASTRAAREAGRPRLRVSLLPSFAAHWLLPRLPQFQALHPDIEIALEPSLALAELGPGGVDLAIRYGRGDWHGVRATRLMDEQLTPVCRPQDLARFGQPPSLHALADFTLLTSGLQPQHEWQRWLDRVGLVLPALRYQMLTDYNIVLQAVRHGQGVAMGRRSLLADSLQRGELLEPFPQWVIRDEIAYWLLTAPQNDSPPLQCFCDWLRACAGMHELD